MIKALLWDFDGLILDTETPDVRAWEAIYAEHGFAYHEEHWSSIIGGYGRSSFDPAAELQRLSGGTLAMTDLRARQQTLSNEMIARKPVQAGVRQYLETAQRLGIRRAVASSSPHAWVEGHLRRLGLHHFFELFICQEEVGQERTKPHPDLYLKALAGLRILPSEAIVLEDSPNGVLAGKAAGIFVLGVPNDVTARLGIDHADMVIKSLAAVPLEDVIRTAEARHS